MSASATVLSFSYAAPRKVPAINPALPPDAMRAQLHIERAISGATLDLLRLGYPRAEADTLVRIIQGHLAQTRYEADQPLLVGWADRMDREEWRKK